MSGLPTTTVKLDDGSGAWATTISTFVRMVDTVNISPYGRTDEFSQAQPSQLSLVLDNQDGRFTNGTVTLTPNQTLIRVTLTSGATTRDRFTGRVVTLANGWPGGGQEFATLAVTATDFLADLGRRTLRSMLDEDTLLNSPAAYYPLTEAQGSTSAGDVSGSASPPLTVAGTGAGVSFGGDTAPDDGLAAVTFAGGKYLTTGQTQSGGAPSAGSFGIWFKVTAAPTGGNVYALIDPAVALLYIDSTGRLLYDFVSTSTSVADGNWHFVLITIASATRETMYLDGVNVSAVSAGGTGHWGAPINPLAYLGNAVPSFGSFPVGTATGLIGALASAMAFSTELSAADALAIYQAGSGALETTDARLSRLASYAGLTATTTAPSGQTMGAQTTSGQSLLDAIDAVATAEGGIVYADGSGNIQMQGRYYPSLRTTADLSLTSDAVDPGTTVTWDTQQKFNQVTVTRTGGATQTVATSGVLARTEAAFPMSLDLAVDTDANALLHAQWLVAKYQTTNPRLSQVVVDLLAPPSGVTAAQIMALDLGQRLALTPMPSQMWSGVGDYTIEGWGEVLSDKEWTLTYNLLPWSLFTAFILDSATLGVLDSATLIGY